MYRQRGRDSRFKNGFVSTWLVFNVLFICNAMTIMGTGASLYAYILLTIMCPKTSIYVITLLLPVPEISA